MYFLKKIFSPLILIVSLIFLTYVVYKSEIYWKGEMRNYYLNYYMLFLSLFCFSIISFFLSATIKKYLIIIGLSTIFSVYLYEGYNINKGIFSYHKTYKKETGKKWDRRSRLQIYEYSKKINKNITLTIYPSDSLYSKKEADIFALSGISNSETIYCNENGYYSKYISDRYGFNNPDYEWDSEEIEYLLIGDSFAHGACINRPNDIASVLRILSKKSVLNLGYGGNGPLIEYATLREYYRPNVKKVLWFYLEGNDQKNLEDEKGNKILDRYLNNTSFTQNLKFKQKKINALAKNILDEKIKEHKEKERLKYKLIKFLKLSSLRGDYAPFKPKPPPEFKKILELTKRLTKKNNSELYFIYLPELSRYRTKYDNTNYNLIKKIVSEVGIPFINIHEEIFQKEKSPLNLFPYKVGRHYNVDGYKKVSEIVYKISKK